MIKLPRHHQALRGPIDMAPLIDVVLLLLIFFMLSSTFVLQPGIRVDPPRSAFGAGAPSNTPIVSVMLEAEKRDPNTGYLLPREVVIFFNDQIMTLPDLRKALQQLNRNKQSNTPVTIKADKEVPLGLLTEIMNAIMYSGMSVVIATQPPNNGNGTTPATNSPAQPQP